MGRMLSKVLREMSPVGCEQGQWVVYYCPGCKSPHAIPTEKPNPANGALWALSGDPETPTLHPSVHAVGRCHCWVRNGMIEFLGDSSHALAGKTVPMVEWYNRSNHWTEDM